MAALREQRPDYLIAEKWRSDAADAVLVEKTRLDG